jgi:hypothetical protein
MRGQIRCDSHHPFPVSAEPIYSKAFRRFTNWMDWSLVATMAGEYRKAPPSLSICSFLASWWLDGAQLDALFECDLA